MRDNIADDQILQKSKDPRSNQTEKNADGVTPIGNQRGNPDITNEEQKSDQFDQILLQAIDKTLRYVLGDINTNVVYNYLERRGYVRERIPRNPNAFSTELRKILGSGRGQILGAASILEETIIEMLCKQLEIKMEIPRPVQFADMINKLRYAYIKRKKERIAKQACAAKKN